MPITQQALFTRVRTQLALDLNCAPEDFMAEGIRFFALANNPGRRPFPRENTHLEMLSMGRGVVVSATPDLLHSLRGQMEGLDRDDAFNLPFVHGQGMFYLPRVDARREFSVPSGITLRWHERADMPRLYAHTGFVHALNYDMDHPRPDALAITAWSGNTLAGMAGVSVDCAELWQVGIDVLPEYRRQGLARLLVAKLTDEVLCRGKIPYYGVAASNIASHGVAVAAGYHPAWASIWRARFEGMLTSPAS